jgi:hypothetical protein
MCFFPPACAATPNPECKHPRPDAVHTIARTRRLTQLCTSPRKSKPAHTTAHINARTARLVRRNKRKCELSAPILNPPGFRIGGLDVVGRLALQQWLYCPEALLHCQRAHAILFPQTPHGDAEHLGSVLRGFELALVPGEAASRRQ